MSRFTTALLTIGLVSSGAGAQSAARLSRPIEYYNPDWSPDGRTIVFESTLSGKYSIYTIAADGSNLTRLTADTTNNEQPTWSPDGKRIVFSSDRHGGYLDIYVMNADGSGATRLTSMSGGGFYQSSFSPDAKWIVFQGRGDTREVRDRVYVVRGDGSGLRLLSDSTYGAEGPRWSPDGKTIEFKRVPYAKRFWNEMGPADMAAARKGESIVSIPLTGSSAVPLAKSADGDSRPIWTRDGTMAFFRSSRDDSPAIYERTKGGSVRRVADAAVVEDPNPSPDGRRFAYTKSVDGWAGLYVYDIASRQERLITGGASAGPLGYLRTSMPNVGIDTLDTFESPRSGGAIVRGNGAYIVRSVRQIGPRRFELADTWFDSTGRETAMQSTRTLRGSLATEIEWVRANTDSASLLVTSDRVTGWVVPVGKTAQLFDGPSTGERYAAVLVLASIAKAKPALGVVFVAPVGSLYGGNPFATRVDSIRVMRRDTLSQSGKPIPVLVLGRGSGEVWVDEASGAEVLSRGNAGPERYWWHIRRGVTPPSTR